MRTVDNRESQERSPFAELTSPDGPFPITLSQVGGEQFEVFDAEPRTLRSAFLSLRSHGDREALAYDGQRWSFLELADIVDVLARGLVQEFGLRKGDRVAIAMRNYPEWIAAFGAAQVIGAIVVPLNAWLTGTELRALVIDSRPKVVFVDRERMVSYREAREDTDAPVRLIGVRCDDPALGFIPFNEVLLAGRSAPELALEPLTPDDLSTILYTSGTTGIPKGVLGTQRNHTTTLMSMRLRATASNLGSGVIDAPQTTVLLVFPLFHVSGLHLLLSGLADGKRIVLMYRWDLSEAIRLIEEERIGELTGPPLIVRQLLDSVKDHRDALSSLRVLGSGGALAPARSILDIQAFFEGSVRAQTGYGLTETSGAVFAISGADYFERPTSIGRPLPLVQARVLREDGQLAAPGETGEVQIRGAQVSPGYWRPGRGASNSFRDGWFRSGDLMRVDPDGFYHLVGRIKDVIIRAGENVYPAEIEATLERHAGVVEAAVYGSPDDRLGEELRAVVTVARAPHPSAQELQEFVAARLAAFKVPAVISIIEEPLPRTATGKLIKSEFLSRFEN